MLDFLVVFYDNKNMDYINYEDILKRLDFMIENDNRPQNELAAYLGKNRQIFYDWKHKEGRKPSLEDLLKISKFYGVPLEYVISGEESPIDDATAAFLVQTKELTEEQKKVIFASIKAQVDMFKQLNNEKK